MLNVSFTTEKPMVFGVFISWCEMFEKVTILPCKWILLKSYHSSLRVNACLCIKQHFPFPFVINAGWRQPNPSLVLVRLCDWSVRWYVSFVLLSAVLSSAYPFWLVHLSSRYAPSIKKKLTNHLFVRSFVQGI